VLLLFGYRIIDSISITSNNQIEINLFSGLTYILFQSALGGSGVVMQLQASRRAMLERLSYQPLLYFWTVIREGGVAQAAVKLSLVSVGFGCEISRTVPPEASAR
jgi:hypothetical protein